MDLGAASIERGFSRFANGGGIGVQLDRTLTYCDVDLAWSLAAPLWFDRYKYPEDVLTISDFEAKRHGVFLRWHDLPRPHRIVACAVQVRGCASLGTDGLSLGLLTTITTLAMIFVVNDSDVYRLEAVLALAAAFPDTITASEIARRRGVPHKFLARLLSGLARAGVVSTTRGPNGGARLARAPEQVKVSEVLRATEPHGKGGPATVWLGRQLEEAVRRTVAPLSFAALLREERQRTGTHYEI